MNTHRFGGNVAALDRPTGVKLTIRAFGEFACDCDEETGRQIGAAILEVLAEVADHSPSAAKLVADPMAFPTKVAPAIGQALAQRGLPAMQLGNVTVSLAPESIAALKAAKAKPAAPAGPAPLAVGAQVLVQWSDGNRYPGEVRAIGDGQVQVAFAGGQVHWIAAAYVARA